MRYAFQTGRMQVELEFKAIQVPDDERARMQQGLSLLAQATEDFASADLRLNVIHHERQAHYNVEFKLKLPGRTLFAHRREEYLDSAFQQALQEILQKAAWYTQHRDPQAQQLAERQAALQDVIVPTEPDTGPLGQAVEEGDYRVFRGRLSNYEEWLRKRVGRWVQRDPAVQSQIGDELKIGDLVEEVYLTAFEEYPQRPTHLAFHDWLDALIDRALKAVLQHPELELENISLIRTFCGTPSQPLAPGDVR